MRLLLWYLAFVFIIGPVIAAPFTGGTSLTLYVMPFILFTKNSGDALLIIAFAWIAPALFLWTLHQFIRLTLRYNARKYGVVRRPNF